MPIDFLITTMDRYHLLTELLDSIFKYYPEARVTIADQSKVVKSDVYINYNVKVIPLHYDCGLSFARNVLVKETEQPYKLLLEDDFLFTKDTKIEKMLKLTDIADVVGGGVYEKSIRIPFEHYFKKEGDMIYQVRDGDNWQEYEGIKYKETGCVMNFALFKSSLFSGIMWKEELKLREHQHFFYRLNDLDKKIVFTNDVSISDNKKLLSSEYKALKGRDEFWKLCLEDLGVKKFQYLNGHTVEIEGDTVAHYKVRK